MKGLLKCVRLLKAVGFQGVDVVLPRRDKYLIEEYNF